MPERGGILPGPEGATLSTNNLLVHFKREEVRLHDGRLKAFGDLLLALRQDERAAHARLTADSLEFGRRTYARTAAAFVEGVSHQLRAAALEIGQSRRVLSPGEIGALTEENYQVGKNGAVSSRPAFVPFLGGLLFTFRIFAKSLQVDYATPDISGKGWQGMRKLKAARDNLMHPKTPDDLRISWDDANAIADGMNWFQDRTSELFDHWKVVHTGLYEELARLTTGRSLGGPPDDAKAPETDAR